MALTVGGIAYVHTVRYFEKGIDQQGPFYNVEYQIDDWDQSDAFVNALLGVGTSSPHRHPLSVNLACTEARAKGKGRISLTADGTPDYAGGATITATYRSGGTAFGGSFSDIGYDDPILVHQIDPSTPLVWCTQELDFSVETVTHPTAQYVWASDGLRANVPFQKDIHITTLVLTFHRRSFLPMTRVRSLRGRLNNATFLGAPAETVHFIGAKTTRQASTDGSVEQMVQLVFKERDESWNKFLRPDSFTWDYIQDGSSNRRYLTGDLSPLVTI